MSGDESRRPSRAGGAKEQVRRLLALLPYLLDHPGARVDEVARLFGISEKQLLNDLSVLWFCGLPGLLPGDYIEVDMDAAEGAGVIHVSNADYLTRPLRLSTDEALGLVVALRVLRDSGGAGERDTIDRLIARLEEAAGVAQATDETGPVAVRVDHADDPEVLAIVRQAVEQRRRLRLTYWVPSRDETTDREVDPMRLVLAEGRNYLEAWCRRAEDVRLFRVDRIAEAELSDEPAEPPEQAQGRDLSAGLFVGSSEDPVAVLELEPSAAWVPEYYPCEQVRDLGEGRQQVTMRVSDPRWLRRLALRLGGEATVIAPEEYVRAVRQEAAAALAGYEHA